jgi:protein SCO1/2
MKKLLGLAILLGGLLLMIAGCAKKEPPQKEARYPLKGKVLSVDTEQKLVFVAHEEIPGFMMAMTMGFKLKDERDFARLQRGDHLQATLVVSDGDSWLEGLFITRPATPEAGLEEPPKPLPGPKAGDRVPEVSFVNQDGRALRLSALTGKVVVLTFIFTRCPLPDFCPRMNQNFAAIARRMAADPALAARLHLLSVSFDTAYDTPPVLRKTRETFYDAKTMAGVSWDFVTGKPAEIRRAADFFGLTFEVKGKNAEDTVHTLRTAVIAPDGRVTRVFTGNLWTVEEVVEEIRRAGRQEAGGTSQ